MKSAKAKEIMSEMKKTGRDKCLAESPRQSDRGTGHRNTGMDGFWRQTPLVRVMFGSYGGVCGFPKTE